MSEDDFNLSYEMFEYLFLTVHNFILWFPAFALAVLLRIITSKFHHQLIFPACAAVLPFSFVVVLIFRADYLVIPAIFYIVVAAGHFSLQSLRENGWLFNTITAHEPWYRFYTLYGACYASKLVRFLLNLSADFSITHWDAIWATLPTQLAM